MDPDNNPVSFYVDWGDGSNTGWTKLYASDETFFLMHSWSTKGNYVIKVKAKDTFGEESGWSERTIVIARSKPKPTDIPLYNLLLSLFEQFPLIARLLQL